MHEVGSDAYRKTAHVARLSLARWPHLPPVKGAFASYHPFHHISSDFISADLITCGPSGSDCAVKRTNSPRLRPSGQDSSTYFVLIGHGHGELGCFTAYSLPLSSVEMKSVEMR